MDLKTKQSEIYFGNKGLNMEPTEPILVDKYKTINGYENEIGFFISDETLETIHTASSTSTAEDSSFYYGDSESNEEVDYSSREESFESDDDSSDGTDESLSDTDEFSDNPVCGNNSKDTHVRLSSFNFWDFYSFCTDTLSDLDSRWETITKLLDRTSKMSVSNKQSVEVACDDIEKLKEQKERELQQLEMRLKELKTDLSLDRPNKVAVSIYSQ